MVVNHAFSEKKTFLEKIISIDYILVAVILLIGIISCFAMYSTDGGKFGKTEDGNVWLDEKKTSPYKFYQFWINISDDDAINFIKIFSLESKNKIEKLIGLHIKDPHLRILQNFLADEITILVHGKSNLEVAKKTSKILFGKAEYEDLIKMNEIELGSLSSAVPCVTIKKSDLSINLNIELPI